MSPLFLLRLINMRSARKAQPTIMKGGAKGVQGGGAARPPQQRQD